MRFLLIKKDLAYINELVDIIKSLISKKVNIEEKNSYIVIYHDYENILDINKTISSFQDNLMINILAYNSCLLNDDTIDKEMNFAIENLCDKRNGIYDLKMLLLDNNKINKKEVLDMILLSSGIDEEFIKGFVEVNLNASKASSLMHYHRNTLNYKLDKLKEKTSFDLKEFKDAYILYSLIEKK